MNRLEKDILLFGFNLLIILVILYYKKRLDMLWIKLIKTS